MASFHNSEAMGSKGKKYRVNSMPGVDRRASYTISKTLVPGLSQKSFAIDAGSAESSVRCAKEAALSARDDIMLGGSKHRAIMFLCP